MTVTNTTNITTAVDGNGSNITFSFSPMVIFASTDIVVTKTTLATGVEEILTAGLSSSTYKVNIAALGYPATGSIQYPAVGGTPMADTHSIKIKRVLPLTQTVDLQNQGGYFPDTQETTIDKLTMMILQLKEELDRCIKLPKSASAISTETDLPTASQTLKINAGGTGIEWVTV